MAYRIWSRLLTGTLVYLVANLVGVAALADKPQTPAEGLGDWVGVLSIPNGELRLWLSVKRDSDEQLQARLESVDQAPGQAMQIKNFHIQENTLRFAVPRISATYQGRWNPKAAQWEGSFTQGRAFDLNFSRGRPQANPNYSELNGHWQGAIKGHPLVVRISTESMGTQAVLDSPDEGVRGLPISKLRLSDDKVSFEIPKAGVKFKGAFEESNQQMVGKWSQKGQPRRKITFVKQLDSGGYREADRPQTPKDNPPYVSATVAFTNPQAKGVALAGTLTTPKGEGPFPAVILISGSGPHDRNASTMGHQPFAVIADYLTRQGLAVLRYDDRGIADSSGDHQAATSLDFASDANAAFHFLSQRSDIDAKSIGMLGHSEGGLIAPLAFDHNPELAFMILLAGPGVDTVELMLAQQKAMATLQGVPAKKFAKMQRVSRQIMEKIRESKTAEDATKFVSEILSPANLAALGVQKSQKADILASYTKPWFRVFMTYDPADHFSDKTLPILALNGELDVQVTPKENLAGLREILKDHEDASVKLLPGLNHMFQQAQTGSISEYRQIEQTISPEVLSQVATWIKARF